MPYPPSTASPDARSLKGRAAGKGSPIWLTILR